MNAKSLTRTAALIAVLGLLAGASPSPAYRMLKDVDRWQYASEVTCDNLDGFAHWYSPEGGINWYVRSNDATAARVSALQGAMAEWTNVAGASHVLTYAGPLSVSSPSIQMNDRINLLYWGGHQWCTGSCLAITTFGMNSSTYFRNVIVEADIMFNAIQPWSTSGSNYDVQAVATHELGHSLGIAHTDVTSTPRPTMYATYFGLDGRSLENDDRAALQCSEDWYVTPSYYGEHWETNCREITGFAYNSKRPNGTSWVEIRDGNSTISRLHTSGPSAHFFNYTPSSYFRDGNYHTINITHWWRGNSWLVNTGQSLICQVAGFPYMAPTEFLDTGGTSWSVGNIFNSSIPGYVTHLRYYKAVDENGWHELKLWTEGGQLLDSAWVYFGSPGSGSGWVEGQLSGNGYPIQANTNYVVSTTTYTKQSKTSCGFSSPIANGPLTFHGGLWKQGDGLFPDTGSCSNYWTDVYFDQ